LLNGKKYVSAHFAACDHATPVLYGAEQPGLALAKGRSQEANPPNPRLHQITELTTASHEHFVGRTWELAGLGSDFIGSRAGVDVKPVAVIIGLGGMGKTALVAEALALWERRFEWVLLYQAKPNPLGFDRDFLWNTHIRLTEKSDSYRSRITANSREAIWLPAEGDFTGQRRFNVMLENLIAIFRAHSILLVLDNFETNLKPQAEPSSVAGRPVWDLSGYGLGSLPDGAGSGTRRLAVAGADHQPQAPGGAGEWRKLSGAARPTASPGSGALPASASRPQPDDLGFRYRGKGARLSTAERQPLSSAADGSARPACGGRQATAATLAGARHAGEDQRLRKTPGAVRYHSRRRQGTRLPE
jgi:hypothetical protein